MASATLADQDELGVQVGAVDRRGGRANRRLVSFEHLGEGVGVNASLVLLDEHRHLRRGEGVEEALQRLAPFVIERGVHGHLVDGGVGGLGGELVQQRHVEVVADRALGVRWRRIQPGRVRPHLGEVVAGGWVEVAPRGQLVQQLPGGVEGGQVGGVIGLILVVAEQLALAGVAVHAQVPAPDQQPAGVGAGEQDQLGVGGVGVGDRRGDVVDIEVPQGGAGGGGVVQCRASCEVVGEQDAVAGPAELAPQVLFQKGQVGAVGADDRMLIGAGQGLGESKPLDHGVLLSAQGVGERPRRQIPLVKELVAGIAEGVGVVAEGLDEAELMHGGGQGPQSGSCS